MISALHVVRQSAWRAAYCAVMNRLPSLRHCPPQRALRLGARIGVLGLTLLLAACQGLWFAGLNAATTSDEVRCQQDIVFDSRHQLALDIYAPLHARHAPVVVFFYGGSWLGGERGWYRFVGDALAAHGVVVAIPDYRKLPDVGLEGFMRDAARAVGWVHAHADEYGGDARRLFVMGHSSGGHIAALLASDPRWLATQQLVPRDLAGCIGLAGVYTFLPADVDDEEMLDVFGNSPEQWRDAAPMAYVRGEEPPMLLLSGANDHEVDPENSRRFAQALRAQGDFVELRIYPHVGHSSLLLALSQPLRARASTLRDVLAFVGAGHS